MLQEFQNFSNDLTHPNPALNLSILFLMYIGNTRMAAKMKKKLIF